MTTAYIHKILLSLVFFLLPWVAQAAEFRLVPAVESVRVGDEFIVEVFLETGVEMINALEGSILFNTSLQLQDIRLVGSVVPLWISAPLKVESGKISFAGVLPGGYQSSGTGMRGNLFTLVFKALDQGAASVTFGSDSVMYNHDGNGTVLTPSFVPILFTILPALGSAQKVVIPEDTVAPEVFTPTVARGSDFGVEGLVLVFATQDKNSGLSHYELASAWFPYMPVSWLGWKRVESPYVFSGDERSRFIYLRAIDKSGNSVLVSLDPVDNPLLAWTVQGILTVLILGVLFVLAFFLARYVRHTKDFA